MNFLNAVANLFVNNASAVSAVVAAVALLASAFFNRRTELRVVRPVLVVVYRRDGWYLVNVGNGPALDVVVAQKPARGKWCRPVRVPPFSKDAELRLFWLGHDNVHAIGATYRDFEERTYTSMCGDDRTTVKRGNHFPHWSESEIKRHWNVTTAGEWV